MFDFNGKTFKSEIELDDRIYAPSISKILKFKTILQIPWRPDMTESMMEQLVNRLPELKSI